MTQSRLNGCFKAPALHRLLAAILWLAVGLAGSSSAQAYCALRDPTTEIRDLFPSSSGHRSIVQVIDDRTRTEVFKRLGLELHFSELGRHTLYIVLDDWKPLGIVHVRSEQGQRGLIEVAWALDMELRVLDFRIQRCREPGRKELFNRPFREMLLGKNSVELRKLLSEDGTSTRIGLTAFGKNQDLAARVIRCAIKTQLVTELAWRKELTSEGMIAFAATRFQGSDDVEWVPSKLLKNRSFSLLLEPSQDPDLIILRVLGAEKEILGFVVHSLLPVQEALVQCLWSVDANGAIVDVLPKGGWLDDAAKTRHMKQYSTSSANLTSQLRGLSDAQDR